MNNIQKYVMIPFHKYEKMKEHVSLSHQTSGKEDQGNKSANNFKELNNQLGEGEITVAPPPGLPEKTVVRWLNLPETK